MLRCIFCITILDIQAQTKFSEANINFKFQGTSPIENIGGELQFL